MADREDFGPRLRRLRERRGITLDELSVATKVSVDLWEAMEENDFSRWPAGIFARAFIRDYARAIGVEPDPVVDEFCRQFPIGDRRATQIVREQAALIGHRSDVPHVDPLPAGRDRRRRRRSLPPPPPQSIYRPRAIAAAIDAICVTGLTMIATLTSAGFLACLGVTALIYFTTSTVASGASPGMRTLDVLRHRAPALFTSRPTVGA